MMAKAEIMPTSVATNPTLAWVPKAAAAAIWSGPQLSIGRPLGAQKASAPEAGRSQVWSTGPGLSTAETDLGLELSFGEAQLLHLPWAPSVGPRPRGGPWCPCRPLAACEPLQPLRSLGF